ncbi:MAG: ATP-binding protein [Myxococcota bacterium]
MTLEQLQVLRRVLIASQTSGLAGLLASVAPLLPAALSARRAALVVNDAHGTERAFAWHDDDGADGPRPNPSSWSDVHVVHRELQVDGHSDGALQLIHSPGRAPDAALAEALADVLVLAVAREEALATERRLTTLFTSGPVVVFRWRNSPGWPVEDVSPNVTKEFGYPVEQLVGQPYAPLVHPADLDRVAAEVAAEVERGNSYFEQQYRVFTVQGETRPVYDFTHVLRDAEGRVTHFHGYVFDDSRRIEAERAREDLERRLQHSQKLEAVGTLASGVAHDFNNVLASVLAHVELARRRIDDRQALADLEQAVLSAQHGRDVVKQMMLFTRAMSEPRAPLLLAPVLERALGLAKGALPAGIELVTEFDPVVPPVLADATQLEQVVTNLLTNAALAMPGGGRLTVRLDVTSSGPGALGGRRCARLVVEDTGQGMSPDVLRRAFEPFFTTREVGKGTGLGLAMVHGIVTAHEGAVALDSRLGEGTTATVWLPCTATPAPTATPLPPPDTEGRGESIAVVDDHVALAAATARLLESFGFKATVFHSAEGVLKAFAADARAFALVLTDQSMPEVTGVELALALRKQGVTAPVVLATGLVTSVDVSEVAPPIEVLGKPYRGEELAQLLVRLVRPAR